MTFGEYRARLNIMHSNLDGADCIFFLKIVSSGLWSDSTVSSLPSTYSWNFLHPNSIASSSFSICGYFCSDLINALAPYAIGCPSWRNAAPRFFECASTVKDIVLFTLYDLSALFRASS